MAIVDSIRDRVRPDAKPIEIPSDIDDRTKRGRKAMLRDAPKRRLCVRFERGDTYWYVNEKGILSFQPTVTSASGGGKPPHRIRNKYNFIRPIVEAKVSAATQRVPAYQVNPTTTDPEAEGAARLAEAVAHYGYDKWRLRNATMKVVKLAIAGGGDGFAMPYFDADVGPYREITDEETGKSRWVGEGELKIRVYSGNQVYWEAGVDFQESSWWAVEEARPVDEVKRIPGFTGGDLTPDATTSDIPVDSADRDNLVMVTEYFERPCKRYPEGRRLHIANGRVICNYRLANPAAEHTWEPYPLMDHEGRVLDEPVLHRLSYTLDPETDRDLGLVWQLIDPQRTIQDCWNKLLEWKNRCLNPKMMASTAATLIQPPTDVPGSIDYYQGNPDYRPTWENPPPVPEALFRMLEQMKQDMRALAADTNFVDETDAAAKTLTAIIEQANLRWQSFQGDLAEWHSRLMRHCLQLVARHYTEPRLLQIRGRFGPYPIRDFQGAQLMGQVQVTVLPESLAVRTKQQITAEIMGYADRGWISPQIAMAAIQSGTAEKLIEGYELDVGRVNRIIQKIRDGTVMSMRTWMVLDPETGASVEQPIWMPRKGEKLEVWKTVFSDWMKTEEYEVLPPEMQEATNLIFAGVLHLEQQEAMDAAVQQSEMAASLGMSNASKPARTPPLPDQRSMTPGQPAPQPA